MNLLNEEQGEKLKAITNKLKQIREQKSITLEQIAATILVRPVFLNALEQGRFEELPEPVYIQGFVRRYADALGLDGMAISQEFGAIACPPPIPQDNNNLSSKANLYIPLAVPYVLLIVGASLGLFYLLGPKEQTVSQSSANVAEQKSQPSPKATSAAVASKTTPKPKPAATAKPKSVEGVKVSLDLQAESWVRVITDGKKVFEGTLQKGDKKSYTAKEKLTIRSGNAGAVLVSVNQNKPVPLGSPNDVKTVTYTPGGGE